MTRTTNSGYCTVRLDDNRQGPVGLAEKGIIIATNEDKVTEWLKGLLLPCMRRVHTLRYATTAKEFDSLVRMPGVEMALIEIGFFGEAMIGCLDRLRKLRSQLRIVLFTVSGILPYEAARYVYWSGGGFISLRDRPERIEGRLKAMFESREYIPEDILLGIRDYDHLPTISPHLTHQEIEIVRCMAQEKTVKEMTYCLKVSVRTVDTHLANIYRKFGIRNRVGILKLAVTQGILAIEELRSYRF
jgi:DNA-binding NarL/FixJ family response regulator